MLESNQNYLQRLKERYRDWGDKDSLFALAEIDEMEDRARVLAIYREQPKTQELINASIAGYRECINKLTNPSTAQKLTETERAYIFAKMDWCILTLDIVGENPASIENTVDELVRGYAVKAGIFHS